MLKKRMASVFLCFLFAVTIGCSNNDKPEQDLRTFLEGYGFKVVSFEGEVDSYVLTKELLIGPSSRGDITQVWTLLEAYENISATDYLNNTITTYHLKVKNHPLDNYAGINQTSVWVMMDENLIIGGYSFPELPEGHSLDGGPYPLDGIDKAWEAITGMTYLEWMELWAEKYKNITAYQLHNVKTAYIYCDIEGKIVYELTTEDIAAVTSAFNEACATIVDYEFKENGWSPGPPITIKVSEKESVNIYITPETEKLLVSYTRVLSDGDRYLITDYYLESSQLYEIYVKIIEGLNNN